MFAGIIPDFHVEVCGVVQDGGTTWSELRWSGTSSDRRPFKVTGVAQLQVDDGQILAGRLYQEDIDDDAGGAGIEQAVQARSGHRPRPVPR